MSKKIELLAPAGSRDAFLAAVENGADAVYLGGKLFNARQFADNFDGEQLKWAVEYAHVRDVNVYLTMNILLSDEEIREAAGFVGEAYLAGIDGVIVQDIGLARILRERYPDLALHASTQMTVYNLEGVKVLERLGFKRVVLARELSLEEIRHIAENAQAQVEIFVHGALCISYSGQCLMSSIIGGRSGNRGKCAQPCRLPYRLVAGGSQEMPPQYILSPRDLCSVSLLEGIAGAGVWSLKIEGRMKNPEYVASVVRVYRKYLDKVLENAPYQVEEGDKKELAQIFNRGGFSSGYLEGKKGKDLMCFEKPKNWGLYLGKVLDFNRAMSAVTVRLEEEIALGDGIEVWNGEEEHPGALVSEIKLSGKRVERAAAGETVTLGDLKGRIQKGHRVYKTSSKSLNSRARETFSGKPLKKVGVKGAFAVKRGNPPWLSIDDNEGRRVCVKGKELPQEAVNRPLTKDRAAEQLGKTGNTPFEFTHLEMELDENLMLPVSEINEMRRSALESLEALRAKRYDRSLKYGNAAFEEASEFSGPGLPREKTTGVSLFFYRWNDVLETLNVDANRVYLPLEAFISSGPRELFNSWRKRGIEVFAQLPAITRGGFDKMMGARLKDIAETSLDGVLLGNLGSLEFLGDAGDLKIMGDYSLNVFNSHSQRELLALGIKGLTLSLELNLGQVEGLERLPGVEREAVVYGRLPLMNSEYCPVGSVAGGFDAGRQCSEACKRGEYKLKDRKGMEFPVLCNRMDCRSTILNSNVLFVPESVGRLKKAGVDRIRLNLFDEGPAEIEQLTRLHRDLWENGDRPAGKYKGLADAIRDRGFTKGHYYRGV